jgi:hypothetical protein
LLTAVHLYARTAGVAQAQLRLIAHREVQAINTACA